MTQIDFASVLWVGGYESAMRLRNEVSVEDAVRALLTGGLFDDLFIDRTFQQQISRDEAVAAVRCQEKIYAKAQTNAGLAPAMIRVMDIENHQWLIVGIDEDSFDTLYDLAVFTQYLVPAPLEEDREPLAEAYEWFDSVVRSVGAASVDMAVVGPRLWSLHRDLFVSDAEHDEGVADVIQYDAIDGRFSLTLPGWIAETFGQPV